MPKHKMTPAYALFFVLFWPDTWRIVLGVAFAAVVGPGIIPQDLVAPGSWLFYIMLATISARVGRMVSRLLKRLILGERLSR